ncbi:MAG: hypothetical protein M1161_00560 [Candidatus Thermoplasmatota archaeon]|jgi:hypothetical protein|nr:hypothetical protein [Candidatus Thermoplasmatota archaeon]
MATRKYLISVSEADASWLDSHPEVSKSGIFQKIINHLKETEKTILTESDLSIVDEKPKRKGGLSSGRLK